MIECLSGVHGSCSYSQSSWEVGTLLSFSSIRWLLAGWLVVSVLVCVNANEHFLGDTGGWTRRYYGERFTFGGNDFLWSWFRSDIHDTYLYLPRCLTSTCYVCFERAFSYWQSIQRVERRWEGVYHCRLVTMPIWASQALIRYAISSNDVAFLGTLACSFICRVPQ